MVREWGSVRSPGRKAAIQSLFAETRVGPVDEDCLPNLASRALWELLYSPRKRLLLLMANIFNL